MVERQLTVCGQSVVASSDTAKRVSGFADLHERQETAIRRLDELRAEFESLAAEQIDPADQITIDETIHKRLELNSATKWPTRLTIDQLLRRNLFQRLSQIGLR